MKVFAEKLKDNNLKIIRNNITTLQVNMGKLCNQACSHCHVEAGPKRTEIMDIRVISKILTLLKKKNQINIVDITGGAPELNANFKYFITELKKEIFILLIDVI